MKTNKKIVSTILILAFILTIAAVPVESNAKGNTIYNQVDYEAVYDYDYYRANNADLRAAFGNNEDLYLKHFVDCGMKEGRQGNESFELKSYINLYPDLRRAFGTDKEKYYIHYLNYGRFEKRTAQGADTLVGALVTYKGVDLSSVYDYQYYIDSYPDLKKAFAGDDKGALSHFVNSGVNEGRIAKEEYNQGLYNKLKQISQNLKEAPTSYFGIDLSPIYDYFYYVWNNGDVAAAFNYDPLLTVKHFGESGLKEGRRAKANYDKELYNSLSERTKNVPLSVVNMVNTINQYSTPSGFAIAVDKASNQVGVFQGQKGNYTLVKQFPCATGAQRSPTPNGVYHVGARGLYFNTGTRGRCWYYTQIKGNYLFHSQIYDRQNRPVNIIDGAMGVAVSHGCIRLYLNDAKWIYDSIPSGTTIVVY